MYRVVSYARPLL